MINKNPPETEFYSRLLIPPNTTNATSWWYRKKKKELKLPWDMANSEALDRPFFKVGQFMPLEKSPNFHINLEQNMRHPRIPDRNFHLCTHVYYKYHSGQWTIRTVPYGPYVLLREHPNSSLRR